MKKLGSRRNNSGQVIIVTALLVAVLLISTAIFVIETGKAVPKAGSHEDNVFSFYEQSLRNTLISALANVTSGGDPQVLKADLNELNLVLTSHSYETIFTMNCKPLNLVPYQNGLWISWDANGKGVSSVYVSYVFSSSGFSTATNMENAANITSEITLSGRYLQLNDTLKQANLTVNVQNEGKPALAQNFKFFFQNATDWIKADSPSITDFGNGTYAVLFNAETASPSGPLLVSMYCQDQRGIMVGSNVTCVNP
jgi:hypothetical protein